MKIELQLTDTQEKILEAILADERRATLNNLDRLSPVKNYLAHAYEVDRLIALDTLLGQLKEPVLL